MKQVVSDIFMKKLTEGEIVNFIQIHNGWDEEYNKFNEGWVDKIIISKKQIWHNSSFSLWVAQMDEEFTKSLPVIWLKGEYIVFKNTKEYYYEYKSGLNLFLSNPKMSSIGCEFFSDSIYTSDFIHSLDYKLVDKDWKEINRSIFNRYGVIILENQLEIPLLFVNKKYNQVFKRNISENGIYYTFELQEVI